jgi:serine-type D-Ala-D-Ala carboxypeptidase/endopeptidase (penicillin-binding protein 4)
MHCFTKDAMRFNRQLNHLGSGLLLLCGWLNLSAAVAIAQEPAVCSTELPAAITAVLQRPEFRRSRWGILVQALGERQSLFRHNAEQYFIPASNVKLLTTAAVLEQLGPQFRIRTSIYQWHGSGETVLQVVGRGDPSLDDDDLVALAQQLRDRGISQIDRLIGDDSYFQGEAVHPTWEWEDVQAGYGAPVNSLMLNQNAIELMLIPQAVGQPLRVQWDDPADAIGWQIDNRSTTVAADAPEFVRVGRDLHRSKLFVQGHLRVGSAAEPVAVSVPQPAHHFMQRFVQALTAEKIQVQQTSVLTSPTAADRTEVAAVVSPPLADLLIETNQQSNNLYAEVLLRALGQVNSPISSTLEAGIRAIERTFNGWKIDATSYVLVDGSGLSRQNLISPEAIVQTLQAMAQSPNAATYRNSLALAGVNGTLENRFHGTPVAGNLQGKTGSLSQATALSGYLEPDAYSTLVFSILVNPFTGSTSQVQAAIDEIVETLAQIQQCS